MFRILLFDIDGTLLCAGGAGRRAMVKAFDDLHGRGDVLASFGFHGLTDPAIARRALELLGVEATPMAIALVIEGYLVNLADEVVASPSFEIMPGVVALLARLARARETSVGLGTGNVRRGAEIKLAHAGLGGYFDFGGFGSDSEDRAELVGVGAERGATRVGRRLAECEVIVVGDTVRDVAAARANRARCLAVATGPNSVAELCLAGATWAVPDLSDPRVQELL